MNRKHILVTGGAGFIGSEIVRQLAAREDLAVFVLDKMTYAADLKRVASCALPEENIIVGGIEDPAAVREAFRRASPDAVIHCAAESHVDRSIDEPGPFLESNVQGTYVLLQEARRYCREQGDENFRFLHVSTDEVYGSLGETGCFTEESPYRPRSPYSASKAASDHLVKAWFHTYGLPVLLANCGNNYGPWQFPEKLIPLMVIKALKGEAMPIYGSGEQRREWIHVADHVRGLLAVLERGRTGETYLIGSGEERSNRAVVEEICRIMDARFPECAPHDALITSVPDRPGHDMRYALSNDKIVRELGWQPQIRFEEGLAETVDWYLKNEVWWRGIEQGGYRGDRLGLVEGSTP